MRAQQGGQADAPVDLALGGGRDLERYAARGAVDVAGERGGHRGGVARHAVDRAAALEVVRVVGLLGPGVEQDLEGRRGRGAAGGWRGLGGMSASLDFCWRARGQPRDLADHRLADRLRVGRVALKVLRR